MKYIRIDTNYEPEITGKRDGAFTVEKKQKSFINKELKAKFNTFFLNNCKNPERILYENFELFKCDVNFEIVYFPRTKSIKQLDFMAYGPHEQGLQFLVTQKVYEIISKYKLAVHNKIPAKIDTFNQEYFLVGFPMTNFSNIDFLKSVFYNYNDDKKVFFESFDDYKQASYNRKLATPQKLFFKQKLNYDIIDTVKGTFFAENIIEEFKKHNITGYRIKEGILEN